MSLSPPRSKSITMSSFRPDPPSSINHPYHSSLTGQRIDHFDTLPDSILLLIFNRITDVKALGRCCVVSRRFQTLVPQVENVVIRVDCVISDDDASAAAGSIDKSRGTFSNLIRLVFGGIVRPIQALGQLISPKRSSSSSSTSSCSSSSLSLGGGINEDDEEDEIHHGGGVTHHSPTQVLKNFNEIRSLKIELPNGELGIDDGVLLKWRAKFGSTLDSCVILGASSIIKQSSCNNDELILSNGDGSGAGDDNGSIPESFYTNGGLKLRVVWTISSLIAASARHYLLQPIIGDHKTLDRVVLTDGDGQGVVSMNRGQLDELRVKPLSASSASKRTLVPALNMRLWYAPVMELGNGTVMKGATLVAIRPSESEVSSDLSWISSAFDDDEPYGLAAKMLVKRRTYCLEMNSF